MLVLSRYKDESIHIGEDVVITVVDVRGDRVRLGIQAPSDISVHRKEVYDAILKERDGLDTDEPPGKQQAKKGLPLVVGSAVPFGLGGGVFSE
ncbi:MAG: carbon storage regulator CsrA [Planctomycetaceae bacterium]|jgi:carbon storage regulator|nr:carbon storage regulator CsrA [Planctomycetaceae bacterium]